MILLVGNQARPIKVIYYWGLRCDVSLCISVRARSINTKVSIDAGEGIFKHKTAQKLQWLLQSKFMLQESCKRVCRIGSGSIKLGDLQVNDTVYN